MNQSQISETSKTDLQDERNRPLRFVGEVDEMDFVGLILLLEGEKDPLTERA